jgi:hypothetical protein
MLHFTPQKLDNVTFYATQPMLPCLDGVFVSAHPLYEDADCCAILMIGVALYCPQVEEKSEDATFNTFNFWKVSYNEDLVPDDA